MSHNKQENPDMNAPEEDLEPELEVEPATEVEPVLSELESLTAALAQQEERYLRLAAEYDNYRKRTAREKEAAWRESRADTAAAFLPVYDNLERALRQESADAAYAKGVEMTMSQLKEILAKLGLTEIEALGKTFDPALHNAVMHIEDENVTANTIVEVFQAGFCMDDKVIRFAMVKVAN